ncbi:MAG: hypothetical protein V3V08_15060 [Nannocystaceae bacterium]
MVKTVHYKRPRKINPVTVSLALAVSLSGYMAYQYLPMLLRKNEAARIIDETSSKFAGRKSRFLASAQRIEQLRKTMHADLVRVGISDPDMETWIEVDSIHAIRFGVAYAETIRWPHDWIEPQLRVFEVERDLELR